MPRALSLIIEYPTNLDEQDIRNPHLQATVLHYACHVQVFGLERSGAVSGLDGALVQLITAFVLDPCMAFRGVRSRLGPVDLPFLPASKVPPASPPRFQRYSPRSEATGEGRSPERPYSSTPTPPRRLWPTYHGQSCASQIYTEIRICRSMLVPGPCRALASEVRPRESEAAEHRGIGATFDERISFTDF